MDTRELVDEKRKAGADLLRGLDELGFKVSSAFWLRQETGDWRLILASPVVRDEGPDYAYRNVQRALARIPETDIKLSDIWVVKDTEPLVQRIKDVINTAAGSIGKVRISNTTVSGTYIEEAHVYRST